MSRFSAVRARIPGPVLQAALAALLLLGLAAALAGRAGPAAAESPAQIDPPDLPILPTLPAPPDVAACEAPTQTQILPLECDTLVDFYNRTGGANWANTLAGDLPWLATNAPCSWYGITCAVRDGQLHVTGIDMSGGPGPFGQETGNNLTGDLPDTLGNLDYLERLDLSFNRLNAALPPEIGHLDSLTVLRLINTGLTGQIPGQIGYLKDLTELDIHGGPTRFTGGLPAQLGRLTNLRILVLGQWVGATGPAQEPIPMGQLPPELGLLTNLEVLRIYSIPGLTGPIPDYSALTRLTTINLSGNNLSGAFPAWLDKLPALEWLYMAGNSLSGSYPAVFSSDQLSGLSLSPTAANQRVPEWVEDLNDLQDLKLFAGGNGGFTGPFPTYVANMSLVSLEIEGNHFDESVMPAALWDNSSLQVLTIFDDTLHLSIPDDLNLPALLSLWLQGKQFTGSPAALSEVTTLRSLYLAESQFTGGLGWLMNLNGLNYVRLNGNQFSGPLPTGWAAMSQLRTLHLDRNRLTGLIPADLADAPNLQALSVGENMFDATDAGVLELLEGTEETEGLDPDWRATQTLPPTAVVVNEGYTTGAEIVWTPPAFQSRLGFYRITAAPQSPPEDAIHPDCLTPRVVETPAHEGKQESSVTVTGLCPGMEYAYRVETVTLPYPGQQNRLQSSPSAAAVGPTGVSSLQLIALALDSEALSRDYGDNVLATLHAGMTADPTRFTVALLDLYGPDNTAIYLLAGGRPLRIDGLPDPTRLVNGVPERNPNLKEYDMGNSGVIGRGAAGNQLGAFIQWAIATYAPDDAIPVTFSFVGHGVALAPSAPRLYCIFADPARPEAAPECFPDPARAGLAGLPWAYPPLPSQVDINPQWTDETSRSMISPYTLSQALHMGTGGGERPLAVLDVVHCFGGTVEEFYELAYRTPDPQPPLPPAIPSPPYAEIILGSPNYTYFSPDLVVRALLSTGFNGNADDTAAALLAAYDALLDEADGYDGDPDVDHPRVFFALRAGAPLAAVKTRVDALAGLLVARLTAGYPAARGRITTAHEAAQHYDTTLCEPQDWRLDAEDGLADLATLAGRLGAAFAGDPAVVAAAAAVTAAVDAAVIDTVSAGGVPWFPEDVAPVWSFADDALGLAIYADFVGVTNPASGRRTVAWQAYWYTAESFGAPLPHHANPHPLAFNRRVDGQATWADVLRLFWQGPTGGEPVPAWACTTALPGVRERAVFMPAALGMPAR